MSKRETMAQDLAVLESLVANKKQEMYDVGGFRQCMHCGKMIVNGIHNNDEGYWWCDRECAEKWFKRDGIDAIAKDLYDALEDSDTIFWTEVEEEEDE